MSANGFMCYPVLGYLAAWKDTQPRRPLRPEGVAGKIGIEEQMRAGIKPGQESHSHRHTACASAPIAN